MDVAACRRNRTSHSRDQDARVLLRSGTTDRSADASDCDQTARSTEDVAAPLNSHTDLVATAVVASLALDTHGSSSRHLNESTVDIDPDEVASGHGDLLIGTHGQVAIDRREARAGRDDHVAAGINADCPRTADRDFGRGRAERHSSSVDVETAVARQSHRTGQCDIRQGARAGRRRSCGVQREISQRTPSRAVHGAQRNVARRERPAGGRVDGEVAVGGTRADRSAVEGHAACGRIVSRFGVDGHAARRKERVAGQRHRTAIGLHDGTKIDRLGIERQAPVAQRQTCCQRD